MKKMMKNVALAGLIGAAVLATGCANRPGAIAPSYVPHVKYMSFTCSQLHIKTVELQEALRNISAAQDSAATTDAITVFLFLIPASALTGGDLEGAVAVAKGELAAIRTAIGIKCTGK